MRRVFTAGVIAAAFCVSVAIAQGAVAFAATATAAAAPEHGRSTVAPDHDGGGTDWSVVLGGH
ncbi:hypothetical protein [Amycolatopsis sp. NBC_01480]|uniref:hypothetical protein n=1 Tax=Amycolatopsis sp. NBC_01480 TaxID=2903562 RepID=UPI002E2C8E7C|nr:hypothetical protein [Amycolatopsis sp. NBC_01480]